MVWEKIKEWYSGKWVPFVPDDKVFGHLGTIHKHWTARVVQGLVRFWLAHWKFWISTAVAALGLLLAWYAYQEGRNPPPPPADKPTFHAGVSPHHMAAAPALRHESARP